MRSFLVALQFLTRISLKRQDDLTEADFGASVKFFPLVGIILGACSLAALFFLQRAGVPPDARAAALVVFAIILSGGIFCDGFMDTADGIFSGRSRERMLEIMKDSRIGANGVMAFASALLFNFAFVADMPEAALPAAIFCAPIAGRFAVVCAIIFFGYARREGMGKAFHEKADKKTTLVFAGVTAAAGVAAWGADAAISFCVALAAALLFCRHANETLGGLTGDVYGAADIVAETIFFAAMLMVAG